MTSLSTLTDTFTTQDTTKWTWGAAASVVSGQLQCAANSSYTGSVTSATTYDLTGSYAYIQVPQRAGPGNGSVDTTTVVAVDASNNLKLMLEGSSLYCQYTKAGTVTTVATLTYSATTHAWWRIREASGTTYWDTSTDGVTWTQRASVANPFAVTAVKVTIQSGYYGTETTPGTAIFDNFNTAPDSTAPTAPGSFTATAASTSQINLSWTASTDNVGVAHYELSRGGTVIASALAASATSYSDTGLTASTTYSYSLVAVDAAGNRSTAATASATTKSSLVSQLFAGSTQVTKLYLGSTAVSAAYLGSTLVFQDGSAPALKPSGSVPGTWTLAFSDEFDGTSVDTSKWLVHDSTVNMNNVTCLASNATVSGGILTLTLSDASHGAYLSTAGTGYPGFTTKPVNGYQMPVGHYAEAKVWFSGDGTQLYNWPAWWASCDSNWPAGGESDIAEVLGNGTAGVLTTNYHYKDSAGNNAQISSGQIAGSWGNGWHTYGMHRKASTLDIYWDGTIVKTISTSDTGAGWGLMLNVGAGSYGSPTTMTGAAGALKVDYVRAWAPA